MEDPSEGFGLSDQESGYRDQGGRDVRSPGLERQPGAGFQAGCVRGAQEVTKRRRQSGYATGLGKTSGLRSKHKSLQQQMVFKAKTSHEVTKEASPIGKRSSFDSDSSSRPVFTGHGGEEGA